MRILLDENMPLEFAELLPGHAVESVRSLGLLGLPKDDLLHIARSAFDMLVTTARGILHQHNHCGHGLRIVVMRGTSNKQGLNNGLPTLREFLATAQQGEHKEIDCSGS